MEDEEAGWEDVGNLEEGWVGSLKSDSRGEMVSWETLGEGTIGGKGRRTGGVEFEVFLEVRVPKVALEGMLVAIQVIRRLQKARKVSPRGHRRRLRHRSLCWPS